MQYLGSVLIVLMALPVAAVESHYYLEYETFRALTALAPELPEPRLVGLPEGGFQLWTQGQMRLAARGYFVEGDFNQDGLPDAALLLQSHDRSYLLIASQMQNRWTRQTLLELKGQSGITLDGNVLVLAPREAHGAETYVAWDGHQYRMASAPAQASSSAPDKALPKDSSAAVSPSSRTFASSATTVPFHFFVALQKNELQPVEVRLSYLGPREESISNLRFVAEGTEHGDAAGRRKNPGFGTIPIPVIQLQELLRRLEKSSGPLTAQTAPKPFSWLSLTVEADGQGPKMFQTSFNQDQAKEVFSVFRHVLDSERLARYHLQSWGCAIGLLPAAHATDVTNRMAIKVSASSNSPWESVSNYLQKGRVAPSEIRVSVTNQSSSVVTGPISVVFNLSGNARIADPDGTTCNTSPVGREFVHLPLRNNQLAPGESVEMPATIANPEKVSIVFDLKVLAGADPR